MKKLIKNLSPYIGIVCLLINIVIAWLYFQPRYSPFALKAKNERYANGHKVWKFSGGILIYNRVLSQEEIQKVSNPPEQAKARIAENAI